jgi:hypothetical protein
MPLDLTTSTGNAGVAERLSWTFDLRTEADPHDRIWFALEGIDKFSEIGRDSSGGLLSSPSLTAGQHHVMVTFYSSLRRQGRARSARRNPFPNRGQSLCDNFYWLSRYYCRP